jgi:hypothetical protein
LTVQDDERERELVRLFNLDWDPSHQREGVDALLRVNVGSTERLIEVEVKSTTTDTVSTARDVSMDHIVKWRSKLFVIGFYSREVRRPELQRCLCLTPDDMAPWIQSIESKIAIDHRLALRTSAALGLPDLYAVCGKKPSYALDDARTVLRQQWTTEQYQRAADGVDAEGRPALTPAAMLEVLRLRALYIARRGATLNNPHITKSHLSPFIGSDRDVRREWASSVRAIAAAWLQSRP